MIVSAETVTVTGEGMTLDLIIWRKFRRPMAGLVEKTLAANLGLAGLGPFLPVGTTFEIPAARIDLPRNDPVAVTLWD